MWEDFDPHSPPGQQGLGRASTENTPTPYLVAQFPKPLPCCQAPTGGGRVGGWASAKVPPDSAAQALGAPFPAGEVKAACGPNMTSVSPLSLCSSSPGALVSHGKVERRDRCECVSAHMSTRSGLGTAELQDAGTTPILEQLRVNIHIPAMSDLS